ncbi:hypothetical protein ROA7450_02588 [Roseovarius albus]|uniref:AAA+ family ATPase n=1 Tax=Roseovarius albus TaxID=1247867 RepID=A0A1X6ZHX1_9RHOB|nr:hypothetical protein [Roseovarius albus]SLN51599.1 hypothetical protein ROA7450_02588 [Roseovarius albus]
MKRILPTTAIIAALAVPTFAQEAEGDEDPSLMEQGMQMLLEEFLSEMGPALKDLEGMADEIGPSLRSFTEEMGPALVDLLGKIEDFSAYHAPEILPNGDIIIRRKTPAEKAEEKSGEDIEI